MFLLLERPGKPSSTWGRGVSTASPPPRPHTSTHTLFVATSGRAPTQRSQPVVLASGWAGRLGRRGPAARPGRGGAWAGLPPLLSAGLVLGARGSGHSSPGPWLHHGTLPAEWQAHHPRQEITVVRILCWGHRAHTTAGPAWARQPGLSHGVGIKLQPLQGCSCPFSPAPPFQILFWGCKLGCLVTKNYSSLC